jgi:predicted ribosome quality control (RQC) complex YloA/Tae2 family protein
MSLNWKEIDLILSELDLQGAQIQKIVQSSYDVLAMHIYKEGRARTILIALTPGACRLHETFRTVPKNSTPLRFAEFLKSRILNSRIEEARQLGTDRIIRFILRRGEDRHILYLRLWSNAANLIAVDPDGTVLDAMRRSPKRGEITGGRYAPEEAAEPSAAAGETRKSDKTYEVREMPGSGSFNERIDAWYAEHAGALSLEALREQARKSFEGRIARLMGSLENLRTKRVSYQNADRLREYGDIIMANLGTIAAGSEWLEAENFYTDPVSPVNIKMDPKKSPVQTAEAYYEQYRKAKNGLAEVELELRSGESELSRLESDLQGLLLEKNPLVLHKSLRALRSVQKPEDKKRPGLSFRSKGWLLIVGRDASENDDLLRHHVKGSDLWLHARDYPGSYVFIKAKAGKSVPLDILLDAGNLALFYSKARNAGEGDLFYTPVKYLRRAKNGPKGLVIPTQEKNLHISLQDERLRELERCRE